MLILQYKKYKRLKQLLLVICKSKQKNTIQKLNLKPNNIKNYQIKQNKNTKIYKYLWIKLYDGIYNHNFY